jgi:hypothetical protein
MAAGSNDDQLWGNARHAAQSSAKFTSGKAEVACNFRLRHDKSVESSKLNREPRANTVKRAVKSSGAAAEPPQQVSADTFCLLQRAWLSQQRPWKVHRMPHPTLIYT